MAPEAVVIDVDDDLMITDLTNADEVFNVDGPVQVFPVLVVKGAKRKPEIEIPKARKAAKTRSTDIGPRREGEAPKPPSHKSTNSGTGIRPISTNTPKKSSRTPTIPPANPPACNMKRDPDVIMVLDSDDEQEHIPKASSSELKLEDTPRNARSSSRTKVKVEDTKPDIVPPVDEDEDEYDSLLFDPYPVDFPEKQSTDFNTISSTSPSTTIRTSQTPTTGYITPYLNQSRIYYAEDFTTTELPTDNAPYAESDPFTQEFLRLFDEHMKLRTRYDPPRVHIHSVMPKAAGTFMRIRQHGSKVLACTATSGGEADDEDDEDELDEADDYNTEGTLIELNGHERRAIKAHYLPRKLKPDPERPFRAAGLDYLKHYTVKDAAYTPDGEHFVTCGEDRRLSLWRSMSDSHMPEWNNPYFDAAYATSKYDGVPSGLAFQPGSSLLAVSERNIQLHHVSPGSPHPLQYVQTLVVDNPTKNRSAGDFVWGCGPSQGFLFASSEGDTGGRHSVFDVERGQASYVFNTNQTGDALGLNVDGSLLALVTGDNSRNHQLQLYDIRTRQECTSATKILPFQFPPRPDGLHENYFSEPPGHEHSCVVFSPDGMYIALARSDNCTHVYDLRMMSSSEEAEEEVRLLAEYKHESMRSKTTYSDTYFGIVRAEWVHHRLVTGGNDGCVRMWDPHRSIHDNDNSFGEGKGKGKEGLGLGLGKGGGGQVIADVPCAIADFSIGDRFKGEHELVVGDAGGVLHLYNGRGSALFS